MSSNEDKKASKFLLSASFILLIFWKICCHFHIKNGIYNIRFLYGSPSQSYMHCPKVKIILHYCEYIHVICIESQQCNKLQGFGVPLPCSTIFYGKQSYGFSFPMFQILINSGSKLGKEYAKAVCCHPAYLTYMQSTS